jgi:REP element-mobilizing transposase RayT
MGEGFEDRKQWIEDRLKQLCSVFAVSVGGFAIMDNHLHVLCRLDPDDANLWSAEEVIRRWIAIYPPANLAVEDELVLQKWVAQATHDQQRVEVLRERLTELGWFMKALKEPLSRLANKQDGCQGAFWQARYKSIAILDDEALLVTCAYIDLNPVAAGIAQTPETSNHTSIRQRVNHANKQGQLDRLKAARQGSVAASHAAGNLEQDHWLIPFEDRRGHLNTSSTSNREGMLDTFSLGSYLLLVDYTGRLFRTGKARMNSAVKEVFDRLGASREFWNDRIKQMLSSRSLRGSCFAADVENVKQFAANRGLRQLPNLSPQLKAG